MHGICIHAEFELRDAVQTRAKTKVDAPKNDRHERLEPGLPHQNLPDNVICRRGRGNTDTANPTPGRKKATPCACRSPPSCPARRNLERKILFCRFKLDLFVGPAPRHIHCPVDFDEESRLRLRCRSFLGASTLVLTRVCTAFGATRIQRECNSRAILIIPDRSRAQKIAYCYANSSKPRIPSLKSASASQMVFQ